MPKNINKTKKKNRDKFWSDNRFINFKILNYFNPVQDGYFRPPLPKICHTYPTMMKHTTVIPYLKKIQKTYQSRDAPLTFCWDQHSFTGNQKILLYQELQI